MAAGDILRESLCVIDKFTVKASEDIELGEIVCDDGSGNGLVAATAALIKAGQKAMVALEAHTYADESVHTISCGVFGKFDVQKVTGSGAANIGDKIMLSSTSGEVTKFVKGDLPAGGASTYYTTTIETNAQTAIDTNLGIIGTSAEVTASGDTTQKIWLGVV